MSSGLPTLLCLPQELEQKTCLWLLGGWLIEFFQLEEAPLAPIATVVREGKEDEGAFLPLQWAGQSWGATTFLPWVDF